MQPRIQRQESKTMIAAKHGMLEYFKAFENHAVFSMINEDNQEALALAAENGHVEIVAILKKAGLNINGVDGEGNTPLMRAVSNKQQASAILGLITLGANVNATNLKFETALNKAASIGAVDIIVTLLDNNADLEGHVSSENSPFIEAVLLNREAAILLLLEKKPSLERKKITTGDTALLIATKNNQLKLVKLLLDCGANIEAKNSKIEKAIDIAKLNHFNVLSRALLRKSEKNSSPLKQSRRLPFIFNVMLDVVRNNDEIGNIIALPFTLLIGSGIGLLFSMLSLLMVISGLGNPSNILQDAFSKGFNIGVAFTNATLRIGLAACINVINFIPLTMTGVLTRKPRTPTQVDATLTKMENIVDLNSQQNIIDAILKENKSRRFGAKSRTSYTLIEEIASDKTPVEKKWDKIYDYLSPYRLFHLNNGKKVASMLTKAIDDAVLPKQDKKIEENPAPAKLVM